MNIRAPKIIPYGDQTNNFFETIRNGSRSRGISPITYGFRRIFNYFIFILAYICPFNKFRVSLNKLKGVNVGKNVYIGMFVFIDNAYPEYIYLEDDSAINAGSMLIAHFNLKKHFERIIVAEVKPIIVKRGAMVAIRSIILPGVIVGEFSMVAAASVVSEDVEPYTLVRGNPAAKIAKYKL